MAKEILRNVTLEVNGVDMSNHCQQVSVPKSSDVVDLTGMKAKNKEKGVGIGDAQVTATLFQDFDDGAVDATLEPLQGENEPFEVVVIPKEGVISKNNPAYRMKEAILPNYNPISGQVNSAMTTDVSFENAGQSGLERITDPGEL